MFDGELIACVSDVIYELLRLVVNVSRERTGEHGHLGVGQVRVDRRCPRGH